MMLIRMGQSGEEWAGGSCISEVKQAGLDEGLDVEGDEI